MTVADQKYYTDLETIVKGFASQKRIAILDLIENNPDLDVDGISYSLGFGYKSVSQHLNKMLTADLITKEYEGTYVLHRITPRGRQVVAFLRRLT